LTNFWLWKNLLVQHKSENRGPKNIHKFLVNANLHEAFSLILRKFQEVFKKFLKKFANLWLSKSTKTGPDKNTLDGECILTYHDDNLFF